MKKILQTVCFGMLLAAGTFTGCSNMFQTISEKNEAVVANKSVVSFSCGSIERTALPTVDCTIYTYELKGTIKDGTEKTLLSDQSYKDLIAAKLSLIPGEWSFTLTASKDGKNILSDTESATLAAGSNAAIAFTLYAVTGGKGTLEITLKYPTGKGVAKVTGMLYSSATASGSYTGSGLEITTAVSPATEDSVTLKLSELDSGVTQYARFFLYDANGVCVGSATDAVYVVAGKQSTDTIELKNINLFTVTVLLTKDGSDWTNFSESDAAKTVVVKNNTTDKSYTLTDSTTTGTAIGSVPIGTYSIYYGKDATETNLTDSGIDVDSVVAGTGKETLDFYSITTSLCDNVSVADYNGTSPVLSGKPYSFTVTPDAGYTIDTATISTTTVSTIETVTVDGVSTLVYTITSVTQPETITVTDVTKITTLYALGQPLLIVKDGSGTTIYVDTDKDGVKDDDEYSLSHYNSDTVTYPADGADLSAYTVYGGWSGANTADTYITMTGGKIFALYGGCDNAALTADSTINIKGGTVVGTVSCNGSGTNGTVSETKTLTISGAPVIGDGNRSGIVLGSITDKYVTVNGKLTGETNKITLIGDDLDYTDVVGTKIIPVDTVVAHVGDAGDATYVTPGKFILRREGATYTTRQYSNTTVTPKITTNDIVVAGGILVPELKVNKGESFDYDGDNTDGVNSNPLEAGGIDKATVTIDGSIFSIFVDPDDGYFTVASTDINLKSSGNGAFDMAVLQDESEYIVKNADGTIPSAFTTGAQLCYVQFRANTGRRITMTEATTYLRNCTFHKTADAIDVKMCLETLDIDTASVTNSSGYTIGTDKDGKTMSKPQYFNGSFYLYFTGGTHTSNKFIYWNEAYNGSKKTTFNGLKGYLMTITSKPENNFIYYECFGKQELNAWISGTRLKCPTSNTKYDCDTWNSIDSRRGENCLGVTNSNWSWACGPEAGMEFSTLISTSDVTERNMGTSQTEGNTTMYKNWNYNTTQGAYEPNNYNDAGQEACVQFVYSGRSEWNDMFYADERDTYGTKNFIVEFTPYENNYGVVCTPDAWSIGVKKTY